MAWYGFQIVVTLIVFYWISTWADLSEYGMAPVAVAFAAALGATLLLSALIDRLRFRVRRSQQSDSRVPGLPAADRHSGDSAKLVHRIRPGQDVR